MNPTQNNAAVAEVRTLAEAVCRGSVTPEQCGRLNVLLLDETAAINYAIYLRMHGLLCWHWQDQPVVIETEGPAALPCDAAHVGLLGGAWQGAAGFFSQTLPLSYLTATVILGVMLLSAWAYKITHDYSSSMADNSRRSTTSGGAAPQRPEFVVVGRVTGMKDCRWADPQTETYTGAAVPLGRKYALSSGLMEITYRSGAKVILEGPCSYEVESSAGGFLALGKLTARIGERGEGRGERGQRSEVRVQSSEHSPLSTLHSPLFSVRTPTAVVTDLGTEFGVEVSENGDTTSHVFQGRVTVKAGVWGFGNRGIRDSEKRPATAVAGGEADRVIQLVAGESARVETDAETGDARIVTGNKAIVPPKFVRRLSNLPDTQTEEAYIKAMLADRPLGYWPLNEPAGARRFRDRSGNGFHGVAMGNVPAGRSGPLPGQSRAIELDGDGHIDVGRQDRFALANGFTVEAWIWIEEKLPKNGSAITAGSFDARNQTSGWGLGYNHTYPPECLPYCTFARYGVGADYGVELPLPLARWMHFVYVFGPDNSGRMFLNGEPRLLFPAGEPAKIGPTWVSIGYSANDGGQYWRGRLAHVAVYGSVLSGQQIMRHYQCAKESSNDNTKQGK